MVLELNSTNSVKTLKLNYHYNRAPMIAQLVKNLAATQPTRIITINHNNHQPEIHVYQVEPWCNRTPSDTVFLVYRGQAGKNDAQLFVKNWWLAFGFCLGGDQGAALFHHSKSRFIWHQTPPPCLLFDPEEIYVLYLRCAGREVGATFALAPKVSPLDLSPKRFGSDISKAIDDWSFIHLRENWGTHIVFPEAEQRNYERLGLIRLFSSSKALTLGINWLILPL